MLSKIAAATARTVLIRSLRVKRLSGSRSALGRPVQNEISAFGFIAIGFAPGARLPCTFNFRSV
jgi:hypothetical protein